MPDLLSILGAELTTFLAATERREYLITRCQRLFDELIEPVDLPGPFRRPVCRARISVVPCRACAARSQTEKTARCEAAG